MKNKNAFYDKFRGGAVIMSTDDPRGCEEWLLDQDFDYEPCLGKYDNKYEFSFMVSAYPRQVYEAPGVSDELCVLHASAFCEGNETYARCEMLVTDQMRRFSRQTVNASNPLHLVRTTGKKARKRTGYTYLPAFNMWFVIESLVF